METQFLAKSFLFLAGVQCLASGAASDCKTLENFSSSEAGKFPLGWISKYPEHMPEILEKKLYIVAQDSGFKAVHATYGNHTVTILRELKDSWNLSEYPILKWKWKAVKLPKDANEDKLKKNDSAASVYVAWKSNSLMKAKAIRYAWSSTQPIGAHFSRRFGNDQISIKESGTSKLNTWVEVETNVLDDYKKYMKERKAPANPIALVLTTDADATQSEAEAFYADFRICRP